MRQLSPTGASIQSGHFAWEDRGEANIDTISRSNYGQQLSTTHSTTNQRGPIRSTSKNGSQCEPTTQPPSNQSFSFGSKNLH
jgi:hypothetical protein